MSERIILQDQLCGWVDGRAAGPAPLWIRQVASYLGRDLLSVFRWSRSQAEHLSRNSRNPSRSLVHEKSSANLNRHGSFQVVLLELSELFPD